jgi:hypothetical protein
MTGHADRRHVYSILLTPSLLSVLLFMSVLVILISRRCRRCLNVSSARQLEMIDSLQAPSPVSPLLLRMKLIDDEPGPRHVKHSMLLATIALLYSRRTI